MRFSMPIQMTIPARLLLASWLVTLVGLVVLAFSAQGQRPAHLALKMAPARRYALKMAPAQTYALKMAPARTYALKMAPARQVLLAGSPGLKSKAGLVSTGDGGVEGLRPGQDPAAVPPAPATGRSRRGSSSLVHRSPERWQSG